MSKLLNANDMRMSAKVKLTSNGDGAKTAKVNIVARTPEIYDSIYGPMVHDLAGMQPEKSKIGLNWEHGQKIGWLNHFEVVNGDLFCSGAIVPITDGAEAYASASYDCGGSSIDVNTLIQRMSGGVPYEASIQHDLEDAVIEVVPEGATASANGLVYEGPLLIVRQWTLEAVAICEDGADSKTSAELAMSKKNVEGKKGFFVRLSKTNQKVGGTTMSNEDVKPVQAVEAPVEVAPVATVEADVKAVQKNPAEVAVEAKAVEAVKTEVEVTKASATVAVTAAEPEAVLVAMSEKVKAGEVSALDLLGKTEVDPQKIAQQMVVQFSSEFGDKAVVYLTEGLSLSDARVKFSTALKTENEDLKKRLAAVDRGADKPIQFSASSAKSEDKPVAKGLPISIAK